MGDFFLKGYAARILLEASEVGGDKLDENRYYRLEIGMADTRRTCSYVAKASDGSMQAFSPESALKTVDTTESLNSDQGAVLVFNGASVLAVDLEARVRPMDRLRIELTNGAGFKLVFDGFVSGETKRVTSTQDTLVSEVNITAGGLWKFLTQSWFNWHGVVSPGYDLYQVSAGQNLYKWLREHHKLPAQDIIKAFIETALSLVELKTSEGLIQPGKFFQFGAGADWKSAFSLAYPIPANTLPSWKGPLVGMIQMMAQPDIHECFCTYRPDPGGLERPTIIFRPRPFPGKAGDDEGWKALTVHSLKGEPGSKTFMASKSDGMRPNAFHWSQGSSSDSGWSEMEQKTLHGYMLDRRSIKRYGFSARPVASSLPPLSQVPKDNRGAFVDDVKLIMERMAYQEAAMPELWTRTVQLPLRPGIHPGDVVEDYSTGRCWTGYVSTVQHRLSANPWMGSTSIGLVRCLPCTAAEYPDKVRELVQVEFQPYVVSQAAGSAASSKIKMAICHAPSATDAAQQPVSGVPWGQGILDTAKARGVPPWVLAHSAHIESAFGTHPDTVAKGGMMQFVKATANGLNAEGYDKPFSWEIAKKDPALSLDAGAWYIAKQKALVDRLAPSTLSEEDRWAWALYAYNRGPGTLLENAPVNGWKFSAADMSMDQYRIYWGPGAMTKARAAYGGLK